MHPLRILPLFVALLAVLLGTSADAADTKPTDSRVRVLIIDGQNNHNWQVTTPYLKKALEDSGRFTVEVATSPAKLKTPAKPKNDKDEKAQAKYKQELEKFKEQEAGHKADMAKFRPDLTKCDVVLSNYNGEAWSAEFQKALDTALKDGKIGLVVFHAADNAFSPWPEYNRMIGLGWRNNKFGDRLFIDAAGKLVRQPKGEGPGAGETVGHPFVVTIRDVEHPITRGMPHEWMHTSDQLVHGLRGPAENIHILATAYSNKEKRGTGENELSMWTVDYGKGRVFHTPMGHDLTALRCVGLTTVLLRGTEWAATGKVTLPIPQNFPAADKTSSYPGK